MLGAFKLLRTMKARDIVNKLVLSLSLEDFEMSLVRHRQGVNWRQKHSDFYSRLRHIESAFQITAHDVITLQGRELLSSAACESFTTVEKPLISLSSRVKSPAGDIIHLPLMNLHLDYPLLLKELNEALKKLVDSEYFLFRTDRFYHVYGQSLMNVHDWKRWNIRFLMTDAMVSPRYIGLSLEQGYNLLRLNATTTIKTVEPYLIGTRDGVLGDCMLEDVRTYAITKHGAQRRKDGEFYFRHVLEVEQYALHIGRMLGFTGEDLHHIRYAALLHDCIEDTDADYEDIAQLTNQSVAMMVAALSNDKRAPKNMREKEHLHVISQSELAIQVIKLADIYSNLIPIHKQITRTGRAHEKQPYINKCLDVLMVLHPCLRDTEPFVNSLALIEQHLPDAAGVDRR